jgi:hypothetical protein
MTIIYPRNKMITQKKGLNCEEKYSCNSWKKHQLSANNKININFAQLNYLLSYLTYYD